MKLAAANPHGDDCAQSVKKQQESCFWHLQALCAWQVTKPSVSRLEAFPSCYSFLIFSFPACKMIYDSSCKVDHD